MEKLCIVCGRSIGASRIKEAPNTSRPYGRDYVVIYSRKKFCSVQCRSKAYYQKYYEHFTWKKERTCPVCKEAFMPTKMGQVNCSQRCTRKKWKLRNRDSVNAQQRQSFKKKRLSQQVEKQCIICFTPFRTGMSYKITCSTKCCRKNVQRRQKQRDRDTLKNPLADIDRYWKVVQRKQVQDANYKAKMRGCVPTDCNKQHIHYADWVAIKQQYNYQCVLCKREESPGKPLTIDHIVPISKQGLNTKENIQPLCRECNSRKGNRV